VQFGDGDVDDDDVARLRPPDAQDVALVELLFHERQKKHAHLAGGLLLIDASPLGAPQIARLIGLARDEHEEGGPPSGGERFGAHGEGVREDFLRGIMPGDANTAGPSSFRRGRRRFAVD